MKISSKQKELKRPKTANKLSQNTQQIIKYQWLSVVCLKTRVDKKPKVIFFLTLPVLVRRDQEKIMLE